MVQSESGGLTILSRKGTCLTSLCSNKNILESLTKSKKIKEKLKTNSNDIDIGNVVPTIGLPVAKFSQSGWPKSKGKIGQIRI